VIFRAVRHLFEGIAIRQEEAREKNLSPPEFKVLQYMAQFYISGVDPDVTLKVVPDSCPEHPLNLTVQLGKCKRCTYGICNNEK
jgi:hypothetical protein